MRPKGPTTEIFRIERLLWNDRTLAIVALNGRYLNRKLERQIELAHRLWLKFCFSNGLEDIPKQLGYCDHTVDYDGLTSI